MKISRKELLTEHNVHAELNSQDFYKILETFEDKQFAPHAVNASNRTDIPEQHNKLKKLFENSDMSSRGVDRDFHAEGFIFVDDSAFILYVNGFNGGGTSIDNLENLTKIFKNLRENDYKHNLVSAWFDPPDEILYWVIRVSLSN